MKRTCFLAMVIFAGCMTGGLYAQANTVAAGNDASSASGSISYSIGQIDYTSSTNATGTVAEGLQQPYEIVEVASVEETSAIHIGLYPNPVADQVNISIPQADLDAGSYTYKLNDIQGQFILNGSLTGTNTGIEMSLYPAGTYLVTFYNHNHQVSVFKIIKK